LMMRTLFTNENYKENMMSLINYFQQYK